MQDEPRTSTDQPVTNVLQIVALNAICVVLTVTGLKLFGFSWSTSIFLGWLGAVPFTLAIAFGIICLTEWRTGDAAPREAAGQRVDMTGTRRPEVSKAVLIQMWQEDVLEDEWAALAQTRQRRGAENAGEPRFGTRTKHRRYNTR